MVKPVSIQKITGAHRLADQPDLLVIEEPLEIRLGYGPPTDRQQRPLAVTMRTPGHDVELVLGYLLAEGIVQSRGQLLSVRHCSQTASEKGNVVRVELSPDVVVDWARLERSGALAASCGVCGKTSIDALRAACPAPLRSEGRIEPAIIHQLPARLARQQTTFAHTGGLHAAALFDAEGNVVAVREDVGRHNALDKLLGWAFWQDQPPLRAVGLLLSGRVGFELVQKAWMAGVPVLAAVGAPSSLAVDLAHEAGITLIGFVRNERFNIYTHADRVGVGCPAPNG